MNKTTVSILLSTAVFAATAAHAQDDLTPLSSLAELFPDDLNDASYTTVQYDERIGVILAPGRVVRVPQRHTEGEAFDFLSDPVPMVDGTDFGSPIFVLRLQNDLTSRDDRQPATLDWSRDGSAGDSTMADAALLLDIYSPGLGVLLRHDPEQMAFRLTAGAEWERNDSGGDSETDVRRYTVGGEFNLFPELLGQAISPESNQRFRFALTYQEDIISGAESMTLDLNYFPKFLFGNTGLVIGDRSYYTGFLDFIDRETTTATPSQLATAQGGEAFALKEPTFEKPPTGNYFFLRPDIGVELGDGDTLGEVFDNISDGHLTYSVETGFGLLDQRLLVSYGFHGHVPFDSDKPSHTYHEAKLTWKGKYTPATITASYTYGEAAPTFEHTDLFKIGIGLKL